MLIGQLQVGAQVHSQNFAYLCVYATTTVSAMFVFLHRNSQACTLSHDIQVISNLLITFDYLYELVT